MMKNIKCLLAAYQRAEAIKYHAWKELQEAVMPSQVREAQKTFDYWDQKEATLYDVLKTLGSEPYSKLCDVQKGGVSHD